MKRVNGVRNYALIFSTGIVAGLIFLKAAPSPVKVAAYGEKPLVDFVHSIPQLAAAPPQNYQPSANKAVARVDSIHLPSASADVLTVDQREKLIAASEQYLAKTPGEGVQIARRLAIVKDGGDPTNICGPLSIAILRDAGIIDPYTKSREFWLLNPDLNRTILEETFPAEKFSHYAFTTPLNEMDWKAFPLQPGDFLYIYAGPHGNFEHMLTVSRVDDLNRAYAVTNYETRDGFIIGEVMLYDPTQPGTGKFYEWADHDQTRFGTTGFGGFELWRLTQPIREKSTQEESLARDLDSVMALHGGEWHVVIKKIDGELVYERQAGVAVDIGSMIKIPVAMLFFKSLETRGIKAEDLSKYLSQEGPDRTYEQLLRAMILHSEVDATKALLMAARENGLDVEEVLSQWRLKNTNLDSRKSSVNDLVLLYQGLYSGNFINRTASEYILNMMKAGITDDYTRMGILQKNNPASLMYYVRRGSMQDSIVAMGDAALVSVPVVDGDDRYVFVAVGGYTDDMPTTDQKLITAIEEMTQSFWAYAQK
jgi:Beta-lactamase enzyme family